MRKIQIILVGGFLFLVGGCAAIQRRFLFFPTHHSRTNGLAPWEHNGRVIGYSREVAAPENVWLMLHGNGGQATDRASALSVFSKRDSIFILEYPGYGARTGAPGKDSIDAAAKEAFQLLRASYPNTPLCVIGESLGSGPASGLARQSRPPEKIVLVVPYDHLARVAAHHVPFLPVRQILGSTWDNVYSLAEYKGPIEIFGAKNDTVIPIVYAKNLAANLPAAKFHEIEGGHNDWSYSGKVTVRNP